MIDFAINKTKKSQISLTPLIDVVFILLIFFMLATSFTKWSSVTLSSGQATTIDRTELKGTLLTISEPGTYVVDEESISLIELEFLIKSKIKNNPDHYLLIKPEKNIPLQELINIMSQMSPIVGGNISLAKEV